MSLVSQSSQETVSSEPWTNTTPLPFLLLSGAPWCSAPHRPAVLLGGPWRLRATAGEHRRRAEPEALRAGVQRRSEPGQHSVRKGKVQDERHLRHAQTQRHPDGAVGL